MWNRSRLGCVCVEDSFACMVQHFALQALDSSPSPPSSSCCPFPVHRCDAAADSLPPNARVHSLPRITPSPSHPFILSVVRLHYLVAGAKIIVIAPRTYPTSFNIIHAFHWKTLWVISTTSWEIDGKKCDSIRNVGVPQNPCRYFRAFCSNSERRGSIIQFSTELPLVLPRDFWLYCVLS